MVYAMEVSNRVPEKHFPVSVLIKVKISIWFGHKEFSNMATGIVGKD